MRKTVEALQAFRRQNQGRYPASLAELIRHGYLQPGDAACPQSFASNSTESDIFLLTTSRRNGGDRTGFFEYELSEQVDLTKEAAMYFEPGDPHYTRGDLKRELLRRACNEQVPLLRCDQHGSQCPKEIASENGRRNATAVGTIYWSGLYWEQEWTADVPTTSRDLNVLFGLKGPPFFVDKAPSLPGAIDLRPWASGFGDVAWWWEYPLFDEGERRQRTPTLRPFFQEKHGCVRAVDGSEWWINGLAQFRGKFDESADKYHQSTSPDFLDQRRRLPIHQRFSRATWLQGTLWAADFGERVGQLVWHFANGQTKSAPIHYGQETARFWGDDEQIRNEKLFPDFVPPAWKCEQRVADVLRRRELRLYRQTWNNPHPEWEVTSLDFVSNTNCPAAPFLIAIRVE